MSTFYEASEEAIKIFLNVFNKKVFPVSIKFQYVGNTKQKSLIKLSKIADNFSFILEKELLVTFNEDLLNIFDEESVSILIEQELDKVSIDTNSGKIKMIKPDLSTFSSLINKYGVDKVARANQIEDLHQQQVSDGQEFI